MNGISQMLRRNFAFANNYLKNLSDFNDRIGVIQSLDKLLVRLYGIRAQGKNATPSANDASFNLNLYQNTILDSAFYGISTNNEAYIYSSLLAVKKGFRMQRSDGSFQFRSLRRPQATLGTRLSGAAQFLCFTAISYQLIYHSRYRYRYLRHISEARHQMLKAVAWLARNDVKLFMKDQDSPHNLLCSAIAFAICGEIFNNYSLIRRSQIFIDVALEMQSKDGHFLAINEVNNNYQSLCILYLLYYSLFVRNKSYSSRVTRAIILGAEWQKSKISSTGAVLDFENSANRSVSPNADIKQNINYINIIKALTLHAKIAGDESSRYLARLILWVNTHD